jgi:hypothetical protein
MVVECIFKDCGKNKLAGSKTNMELGSEKEGM